MKEINSRMKIMCAGKDCQTGQDGDDALMHYVLSSEIR